MRTVLVLLAVFGCGGPAPVGAGPPAALAALSDAVVAVYAVGVLAALRGEIERAAGDARRLDALDPGDAATALARARLHAATGARDAAAAAWCEAAARGADRAVLLAAVVGAPPCAAWGDVRGAVTDGAPRSEAFIARPAEPRR